MTDHDDNCPDPKRTCPVSSKDMLHRLEAIERKMDDEREMRHDRNQKILEVIDEERVARMDLEQLVRDMRSSINDLADMHKQVLELLQGSWGREGMVKEHAELKEDMSKFKLWRSNQKAFFAGMAAICGIVGSFFGIAAMALFNWLLK